MTADANKAIVQRLFDEVWNGRRYDVIDELYAPDYVADYRPYSTEQRGREAVRGTQHGAWGPVPPTGKPVNFEEILILTFRNGQVVHQRGIVDNLNALRQLGVIPAPR